MEYNDNYSKTFRGLVQYSRDEQFLKNGDIIDVCNDPDSASFKYKQKITGQTEMMDQNMFK